MWPWHTHTRDYYPPLPLIENEQVIATNPDHFQFTLQFTKRAIEFIHRNSSKPFYLPGPPLPDVPLGVSGAFSGKSEQGIYGEDR